MTEKKRPRRQIVDKGQSRVPEDSAFYNKVVPALLLGMVVLMIVLILVAVGVLVGIIPFG